MRQGCYWNEELAALSRLTALDLRHSVSTSKVQALREAMPGLHEIRCTAERNSALVDTLYRPLVECSVGCVQEHPSVCWWEDYEL